MENLHNDIITSRQINKANFADSKDNIDKTQNDLLSFIHSEFIEAQRRNEKAFDDFKIENKEQHKEIIFGKETAHASILGKIDRSIEVANALASEMRGCYSIVDKRQMDYEIKQGIQTYKIALVVAGITFALTLFFQYLWDILAKKV